MLPLTMPPDNTLIVASALFVTEATKLKLTSQNTPSLELVIRQIELEEILLPSFASAVAVRRIFGFAPCEVLAALTTTKRAGREAA